MSIPATGTARIEILAIKNHGPAIREFIREVRATYRTGPGAMPGFVRDLKSIDFDVDDGWIVMDVDEFRSLDALHEDWKLRLPEIPEVDILETLNVEFGP